jgi:drug/metabolite transporter (DMT)-like permease
MAVGGVWIPVTLLASSAQTLRNAMQRDLIGALGAVGAAQVRFLFGLPFAVMFLAGLLVATGLSAPRLTAVSLVWTVFGAVSQVIATSLMLAAMRTKSFVVAVAYTKTEAAQIALFGLIALNNPPTAALIAAIALATIGVALMAIRSRKELVADWRSAALGLFSATFFAFAAIGFRSAVIGVESPSLVLSASVILVVGLAIQSAALGLYLAGFMGALASQLWFVAFALSEAAPVRTLALIEVPMAQVVSLKMFREPPSLREGLGISLIVIAAGILVWTAR